MYISRCLYHRMYNISIWNVSHSLYMEYIFIANSSEIPSWPDSNIPTSLIVYTF